MNSLVTISTGALPALVNDIELAATFAQNEKAESTRAAYSSDWKIFQAYCRARGVPSLPAAPEVVAGFLSAEATTGRKTSTIGRRCASIRHAHKLAGFEPPTGSEIVKATLAGIRRTIGASPRQMAPATAEVARDMASAAFPGVKGIRDRAILLLGFSLAARRSELVQLNVEDIQFCDEGLRVTIRKSKTDQTGQGAVIAVCRGGTHCAVRALQEWLSVSGITSGPVFRPVRRGGKVRDTRLTAQSICLLVEAYAGKIDLPAADFGAHSLRAGAITTAARRGASVFKIKEVSRHKSIDTLAGYVRDANLFDQHCLAGVL